METLKLFEIDRLWNDEDKLLFITLFEHSADIP